MMRRVLVCAAFATWCFLNTWVEFAEGEGVYFARFNPLRSVVPAVLGCEVLIAVAMFLAWEWVRKHPRHERAARLAFLTACAIPVGIGAAAGARLLPFDLSPVISARWYMAAALSLVLLALLAGLRFPVRASRGMRTMFLYSWPVLAIVLIQGWRGSLRFPDSAYADGPRAPAMPSSGKRARVVWIIFDELSQQVVFDRRPRSLQLPNFDRLREESFYASEARAPSGATNTSLPALLTGEHVANATHSAPDRVWLEIEGRPGRVDWSEAPSVFDDARAMGLNTALAGWYHPYGRILSRSLTRCEWIATWLLPGTEEATWPQSFLPSLADRAELQFRALPLVGHVPVLNLERRYRSDRVERFSRLLQRALEFTTDSQLGLVFLHLPAPHWPVIYNRAARGFDTAGELDYFDNVALADRTLGEVMCALESTGEWDRTAILVSSDHGWRTSLWPRSGWTAEEAEAARGDTMGVPFLLKLPGQHSSVEYDQRFDTVVSRRVVDAILKGALTDAAQVGNELERSPSARISF